MNQAAVTKGKRQFVPRQLEGALGKYSHSKLYQICLIFSLHAHNENSYLGSGQFAASTLQGSMWLID